jgi:acyl-CoA thioesterase-1
VLGDSLSAGYRMPVENSWPSLLPHALENHGLNISVINGSISGDTTGNGLDRLPGLLRQHNPDWILVELGANDGLRGFPPHIVENNLRQIIRQGKENGSKVALMQILIPPNYGKRYAQAVESLYPELAEEEQIPLLPFFLKHVILKEDWMMSDGLHPKAVAQPWIADFMADNLAPYLAD